MPPDAVFIDTWGWVALGHRRDARHTEVAKFYKELRSHGSRIVTSDFVLDEVVTLLFRRETFDEAASFIQSILNSASQGFVKLERVTPSRFDIAWQLRRQYHDKPNISFTDLATIAITREHKMEAILTDDAHFTHVGLGFQLVP